MIPVSCYFFSGEAVFVERNPETNDLFATVYFDRDRLERALLESSEQTIVFRILERIQTSDLPEHSKASPIRFSGWTAVRLLVMLPMAGKLGAFDDENMEHQQWFFYAIASVGNKVRDRDSIPKLILFAKTPKHAYHVCLVHSQRQAARVCHELGARLPPNCVEALLTLPPDADGSDPIRLTGSAAKALTQVAYILSAQEELFGDQDDVLFAAILGFGTN